jgi:hypothetical protein
VRRKTADGRRQRKCARGRWSSLVGRLSRKCRHSGDQRETGIRRRGMTHREAREVREERFHHKGTKDIKGKRCKPQAQRARRKEGYGLRIIRPRFRPPVVRVVPGHGGKILTTEITENTENRWLALFIPLMKIVSSRLGAACHAAEPCRITRSCPRPPAAPILSPARARGWPIRRAKEHRQERKLAIQERKGALSAP